MVESKKSSTEPRSKTLVHHLSGTMCIAIVFLKRTDLKCFEAVAPVTCIEYFMTHVYKKISLDAVFATARAQSAYIRLAMRFNARLVTGETPINVRPKNYEDPVHHVSTHSVTSAQVQGAPGRHSSDNCKGTATYRNRFH